MKIGSLVELVDDKGMAKDRILPIKGVRYTVREIQDEGIGLYLCEITNEPDMVVSSLGIVEFCEPGFLTRRFRELLPPIANIEEHINKNTLEEEMV